MITSYLNVLLGTVYILVSSVCRFMNKFVIVSVLELKTRPDFVHDVCSQCYDLYKIHLEIIKLNKTFQRTLTPSLSMSTLDGTCYEVADVYEMRNETLEDLKGFQLFRVLTLISEVEIVCTSADKYIPCVLSYESFAVEFKHHIDSVNERYLPTISHTEVPS